VSGALQGIIGDDNYNFSINSMYLGCLYELDKKTPFLNISRRGRQVPRRTTNVAFS